MLRDIVKVTQLDPKFCAGLFGVTPEQFYEWMSGVRPIPRFLLPELASVFGVLPADVTEYRPQLDSELAPAIWYKLRTQGQNPADLQFVGLIRKLCFNVSELQSLLNQSTMIWETVSNAVRSQIDQSGPIAVQARKAAEIFRAQFHWQQGQGGIGDLIRPNLRRSGLVIVESPVADSQIEGCSFRVKAERDIACVFSNSYQSTWFRRNFVILHEVCHSIFDLEGDPVSIDYQGVVTDELKERRANLFAQECLVPRSVLIHAASKFGIDWAHLTPEKLARLVADCHVEQRLLLRATVDAKLISIDEYDQYAAFECAPFLREFSTHALSTREFFQTRPKEEHPWLFQNRLVKVGNRSILLPAGYLKTILDLLNEGRITTAKAAELTMMDRYTFQERFESMISEAA
jgi:Zn-dependent peptidase ImmA (M78 family)